MCASDSLARSARQTGTTWTMPGPTMTLKRRLWTRTLSSIKTLGPRSNNPNHFSITVTLPYFHRLHVLVEANVVHADVTMDKQNHRMSNKNVEHIINTHKHS